MVAYASKLSLFHLFLVCLLESNLSIDEIYNSVVDSHHTVQWCIGNNIEYNETVIIIIIVFACLVSTANRKILSCAVIMTANWQSLVTATEKDSDGDDDDND